MYFTTTHTKPGHSKANTTLSVSDYTKLLQIAAEARKLIGTKYDRLTVGRYRVFTEPRKGGLRTKLWGSGHISNEQVIAIEKLLTKRFPEYAIKVEYNATKQFRWYLEALSIFITMKPVIADPKPAVVEEKPKARLCGSPLIMRNAVVDLVAIPAGMLSLETQVHVAIGSNTKELEFELCDSWLVLNGKMIDYKESDRYENYLEMHLGRSYSEIADDAQTVAEELICKSIVLQGDKLFVG